MGYRAIYRPIFQISAVFCCQQYGERFPYIVSAIGKKGDIRRYINRLGQYSKHGDSGWKSVMDEEMIALRANKTWEFTSLPPRKQTVGCRWIYTIKFLHRLSNWRHGWLPRATHTYSIDYFETLSSNLSTFFSHSFISCDDEAIAFVSVRY